MQFSESWLRSLVNPNIDIHEICEKLTKAGLELESIEEVLPNSSGLVIAKILETEKHPEKKKLTICKVDIKTETLQVICGADNVKPGILVVLAKPGCTFKSNQVAVKKFAGFESNGFLCSEFELNLKEEESGGILVLPEDAPVGSSAMEYLELSDKIIDVAITPNRGDCVSVLGIAREVKALTNTKINYPDTSEIKATIDDTIDIDVQDKATCLRYSGRVIKNINQSAKTPKWMIHRLQRSGIRSISPIVDITNYIMLELGQPMHAFDLSELQGGIVVRKAQSEKLTLLDETEIELSNEDLVIADKKGPLALAGVMGGMHSGITSSTKDIVLESALFDHIATANSARRHKLSTDSSFRFERQIDYQLQTKAIEYATRLILEITGGEPGPVINKSSNIPDRKVTLRLDRLAKLIGISFDEKTVTDILTSLEMQVESNGNDLEVTPPSHRNDIQIEEDLVEEVARIYGYDNIESKPLKTDLHFEPSVEGKKEPQHLKDIMVNLGYTEVITYSFIDKQTTEKLYPENKLIEIINPISQDMSVMRPNLFIGLLKTLEYNQKRKHPNLKLFEYGLCFTENETLKQENKIACVFTGDANKQTWDAKEKPVDFFDIKGDLEELLILSIGNLNAITFERSTNKNLHPGQSALIKKDGQTIGEIGAIHPTVLNTLGIKGNVFYFELDVASISNSRLPVFEPLSKYPIVVRDLSILLDDKVDFSHIQNAISPNIDKGLIFDIILFDVYKGNNMPSDKKSLALRITLQHPLRTLVDTEVNDMMDRIINVLEKDYSAELRVATS